MINRDRIVKTFMDLAVIDSPSGEEEAMAQDLITRLTALVFRSFWVSPMYVRELVLQSHSKFAKKPFFQDSCCQSSR